jgi:hypothetical protein
MECDRADGEKKKSPKICLTVSISGHGVIQTAYLLKLFIRSYYAEYFVSIFLHLFFLTRFVGFFLEENMKTHFGNGGKPFRAAQNRLVRCFQPARRQWGSPNRKDIHIITIIHHLVEFVPTEMVSCFSLMTEAKPKTCCSYIMRRMRCN